MDDPRDQAEAAFRQAQNAARRGDIKEAERWSKVAERMADAAQKFAALPPARESREEEQAIRAEVCARIQRLVDMDREIVAWQAEAQAHAAEQARCLREGLAPPAPLAPAPWSDADVERVVKAPFPGP